MRAMHRLSARLSTLARPATGFVSQPEPRSIGSYAKGKQLSAGNFLFAGFLIESRDKAIWDIAIPDHRFEDELHGFAWLDDLAAVGDAVARSRAQDWTFGWIARYGRGSGPGWTPDLTGRRLIRWINHAILLLNGREKLETRAYFRSLGQQTIFLARRWKVTSPGLPRFEALTGLIYAGLSLSGMERHVATASAALARECAREIDAEGGIPTRNPEELLDVFALLSWAARALTEAGRRVPDEHRAAMDRIAPTLRALRHADGGLARFHGGGRGAPGLLDQALAEAHVPSHTAHGMAMGFVRLTGGRTTLILDGAAPAKGRSSTNAHASTLAFELCSGRRPLIVNCGSGATFGAEWRRAGRATPSHSTLCLKGFSSSRLGVEKDGPGARAELDEVPEQVWAQAEQTLDGMRVLAGHNGYAPTHGMTHLRELQLSLDGRALSGEDTLGAMTGPDRRRFDQVMERTRYQGIDFDLRFHIHPDVDATLDLGGTAVSMALKSGEIWVFRHDGVGEMRLEPSVYLEVGRLKPRATKQIVLSGTVLDYACQLGWTLAKAQDTPAAIRDTEPDDRLRLTLGPEP
ncbi:heparinase II/III family protein [Frigidibacter sp. RF13]|nr:heparinase II/III family protein [Frigidibacter sp. RF13]